jgi:hypothetical protein
MNPLSLLTKGRTILGLRERPDTYKMLEESVLPNFSAPKHPHFRPSQPEPANPQPALAEKPQAEAPAPVSKTAAPMTAPAAAPAPAKVPVPAKPGPWRRLWGKTAGWARKWMPWRKAATPGATVQTELALNKVKVLRNDLSEDDLEVVAMDEEAGKKTEKPAGKAEREKQTVQT